MNLKKQIIFISCIIYFFNMIFAVEKPFHLYITTTQPQLIDCSIEDEGSSYIFTANSTLDMGVSGSAKLSFFIINSATQQMENIGACNLQSGLGSVSTTLNFTGNTSSESLIFIQLESSEERGVYLENIRLIPVQSNIDSQEITSSTSGANDLKKANSVSSFAIVDGVNVIEESIEPQSAGTSSLENIITSNLSAIVNGIIYVNATTGSDTHTGENSNEPMQTLTAAFSQNSFGSTTILMQPSSTYYKLSYACGGGKTWTIRASSTVTVRKL